jgi:hypothetical protein
MNNLAIREIHDLARKNVDSLIRKMTVPDQPDCPVFHHFGPGTYLREARYQAGTVVIGHHHRHEHLNIFVQGKLRMLKMDGTVDVLTAPMVIPGNPGRKIAVIEENVIWQNVWATDLRDIDELEAWCYDMPEYWKEQVKLLVAPGEDVSEDPWIDGEVVAFPPGLWNSRLAVRQSRLFAEANIMAGEIVCPARFEGKCTVAGKHTRHSESPNVAPILVFGTDIGWLALRDIHGRRGGLDGEEITVDYREVRKIA